MAGTGRISPPAGDERRTDDEAVLIEAEIPGLKSDQLEISVSGDELSLKVQRPDLEEEGVTYHRREPPTGTLRTVVRLPTEVNAERVQAELRDGVLRITLPKVPAAKPRRMKSQSPSEDRNRADWPKVAVDGPCDAAGDENVRKEHEKMSEQLRKRKRKATTRRAVKRAAAARSFRPNCDLLEREQLLILADVPGAKGSQINVGSRTAFWSSTPRSRRDSRKT